MVTMAKKKVQAQQATANPKPLTPLEELTPEVRARARERATIGEVFSEGRAGMITAILLSQLTSITGFSIMTALFALYCEKRFGYDTAQVGYLLAYVGILGAIFQG